MTARHIRRAAKVAGAHFHHHIRRAGKDWPCAACSDLIPKGTRHFCSLGNSLPYGRYITAMVEARLHLECVSEEHICCSAARDQIEEELAR
jgi:hypothetical protein